jgi:hypothetical protein
VAGAAAGGAQRELAAGARCNFTLVSRACRGSLVHLPCQRELFPGNEPRLSVSPKGIAQLPLKGTNSYRVKNARKNNRTLNEGNPVIFDWVQVRLEYLKDCSAGGCAQRQAALRGKVAAGARFNFTLVSRACRGSLEHPLCHGKRFSGNRTRLMLGAGWPLVLRKLDAWIPRRYGTQSRRGP